MTILKFLPVWCQYTYEVNLIKQLNDFFDFDHNIFFLDHYTDHNRYIPTSNLCNGKFTAQTIFIFEHNAVANCSASQLLTFKTRNSKKTFLVVVTKSLKFENNTQLWAYVKAVRELDGTVKIGVFFTGNITSTDTIKQLFRWSWSVGIVNIFGAFYKNLNDDEPSLNVISYNPFETTSHFLVNLTRSESLANYFVKKVPNYYKHPLRFVLLADSPRMTIDEKFWDVFIRVFNATASISFSSFQEVLDLNTNKDILSLEMTYRYVNQYGYNYTYNYTYSYPHQMITSVLVVPHSRPYSDFLAYLRNGTWERLFFYTLAVIVAASLLLIVSGYWQTKKILLLQCVADVINLLMNDNAAIRYGKLHLANVFVIVPLTFTGFIVVNGILSIFQSYITLPIYERQINTIDDLFKSQVPIVISEVGWSNRTLQMLESVSQHGGWNDKIHKLSNDKIRKDIKTFNNSIAFLAYEHETQSLLEVQKRLGIKTYYVITEKYLAKFIMSFLINKNFPFMEYINEITHRIQSAGLMDKWLKDKDETGIYNLWKLNLNRPADNKLDNGEFAVPTIVWCGWIVSGIAFICEIMWNKVGSEIEKLKVKLLCRNFDSEYL